MLSWNSSTLATWCEELTHWTRPWYWEGLGAGEGDNRDVMAGWHHRLDGHESEWTLGASDGQGGLACCDSWGRKELDTQRATELKWTILWRILKNSIWNFELYLFHLFQQFKSGYSPYTFLKRQNTLMVRIFFETEQTLPYCAIRLCNKILATTVAILMKIIELFVIPRKRKKVNLPDQSPK